VLLKVKYVIGIQRKVAMKVADVKRYAGILFARTESMNLEVRW
jgi:hypothetical protein